MYTPFIFGAMYCVLKSALKLMSSIPWIGVIYIGLFDAREDEIFQFIVRIFWTHIKTPGNKQYFNPV